MNSCSTLVFLPGVIKSYSSSHACPENVADNLLRFSHTKLLHSFLLDFDLDYEVPIGLSSIPMEGHFTLDRDRHKAPAGRTEPAFDYFELLPPVSFDDSYRRYESPTSIA